MVQTTYPGVYVVEIPSGVHSIAGVATSITAFVGYTASGLDNTAVELFSFQDYVRNFGGLASNSELSYAVQQFFGNGGTDCFVVRVPMTGSAIGTLMIGDANKNTALILAAKSSGSWSQSLIVEVDYNNISPASTQVLPGTATPSGTTSATLSQAIPATGTGLLTQAGLTNQWIVFTSDPSGTPYQITAINAAGTTLTLSPAYASAPTPPATATTATVLLGYDPTAFNLTITDTNSGQSESFPNLSMSSSATNYVQSVVNDPDNGSSYVTVLQSGQAPPQLTGFFVNPPGETNLGIQAGLTGFAQWLQGPGTVGLKGSSATVTGTNFNQTVAVNQSLVFAADYPPVQYVVQTVNSDTELTLSGPYTGAASGVPVTTTAMTEAPSGAASFVLNVTVGGVAQPSIPVTLWSASTTPAAIPTTSLAQFLRLFSVQTARALQAQFPGAQVTTQAVSPAPEADAIWLQIDVSLPNNYDAVISFAEPTPAPASGSMDVVAMLGLSSPTVSNVGAYYFAHAATPAAFQLAGGIAPADGTAPPTSVALVGNEAAPGPGGTFVQTGMYALDKVSLFNILCFPDATRAASGSPTKPYYADSDINAIYSYAMTYCKTRRAFLLVDSPPDVIDVATAINWRTNRLVLNDTNGAVYFPRVQMPDPLNNNQLRSFAPCGVVAGIYATEDANRGVWKAPAGIETSMSGVQKLTYNLTDDEQGVLNPIALNCFRNFPIYGPVIWGARTLVGADQEASEWKYIPVRRFALYLEQSLYQGLQWVVFEPNAEPLWAQIRLNVTSFMQTLFLQNAFQGTTPATAYFVQCDSTTTTQADIDNGIVNIIVGFAPLEPAEFVVLQLQQMAGQLAV